MNKDLIDAYTAGYLSGLNGSIDWRLDKLCGKSQIPDDRECHKGEREAKGEQSKHGSFAKKISIFGLVGIGAAFLLRKMAKKKPEPFELKISEDAKRRGPAAVLEEAEDQIRTLDHEVAVVIHPKTGEVLGTFTGDSHGVTIPSSKEVDWSGAIFTHNHPPLGHPKGSYAWKGVTFSPDDISSAASHNFAEMRAVGNENTFSVKKPKKGWDERFVEKTVAPAVEAELQEVFARKQVEVWLGRKKPLDAQLEAHHETYQTVFNRLGMEYSMTSKGSRKDSQADCGAESKPCGKICIPKNKRCREGENDRPRSRKSSIAAKAAISIGAIGVAAMIANPNTRQQITAHAEDAFKKSGLNSGETKLALEAIREISASKKPAETAKRYLQVLRDPKERAVARNLDNPVFKAKMKIKLAVDEYLTGWKHFPVKTAAAHASGILLAVGAEQLGEQLGYVPQGALQRTFSKEAVERKAKDVGSAFSRATSVFQAKAPRVTSRKTSYGG